MKVPLELRCRHVEQTVARPAGTPFLVTLRDLLHVLALPFELHVLDRVDNHALIVQMQGRRLPAAILRNLFL